MPGTDGPSDASTIPVATFSTSDGFRLRYEIEGTGPGLVLHLGAGCDASLWRAAGYVAPL